MGEPTTKKRDFFPGQREKDLKFDEKCTTFGCNTRRNGNGHDAKGCSSKSTK